MNELLSRINIKIRESRPLIAEQQFFNLWKENHELQIFIKSRGCRYSLAGSCTMCEYGASARNLTLHETAVALRNAFKQIDSDVRAIAIGSYGSFLDPFEIPLENRNYILEMINRLDIQKLTIETHYRSIDLKTLNYIADLYRGKEVTYELGLESSDIYVQEMCLNKTILLDELEQTIQLIHHAGGKVMLNILYGAPFLNLKERAEDTLQTIQWAFEHGADNAALFPVNIKQFTLIELLFKHKLYRPVSQWEFIDMLNRIPEEWLDKIIMSWYGNRTEAYEGYDFEPVIPRSCDVCREAIMEFYKSWDDLDTGSERKTALCTLLEKRTLCSCWDDYQKALCHDILPREENIIKAYNFLRTVI